MNGVKTAPLKEPRTAYDVKSPRFWPLPTVVACEQVGEREVQRPGRDVAEDRGVERTLVVERATAQAERERIGVERFKAEKGRREHARRSGKERVLLCHRSAQASCRPVGVVARKTRPISATRISDLSAGSCRHGR